MPSSHFSKIVFIQSLRADDPKTGRRIYDDVSAQCVAHQRDVTTEFKSVESASDFRDYVVNLTRRVEEDRAYPIVHIDCHGDSSGLELADGSCLLWTDIKSLITALNIASRLNLFITLAACQGAYLTKVINPTDRAPVWGLLSPTETAFPFDLEKCYSAFYSMLIKSLDGDKALESFANANSEAFGSYFVTAQGFFEKVYRHYLNERHQSNGYWISATRIRHMLREMRSSKIPDSSEIVGLLKSSETAYYDRFHSRFFMVDLFPENALRFEIAIDGLNDVLVQQEKY